MVESENEDLKKRLSSSGGRSPPPVSQLSAGAGTRSPPYSAGNRGQGVSEIIIRMCMTSASKSSHAFLV